LLKRKGSYLYTFKENKIFVSFSMCLLPLMFWKTLDLIKFRLQAE